MYPSLRCQLLAGPDRSHGLLTKWWPGRITKTKSLAGPFPVEEVIDQDYAISVALPPHLDLVWPVMHPWHLRPAKHPKFRNRPIKFLKPDPTFPVEELRTSGSQKHPTKKALPSQVQRTRPTVQDVATRIPDQLQTHHHRLLETTQTFWHRR